MKYINLLTRHVELKLTSSLPDKFALIFDGWLCGTTHDTGTFDSYASIEKWGYSTVLLGMSTFVVEKSQSADHHISFISYVLSDSKKK